MFIHIDKNALQNDPVEALLLRSKTIFHPFATTTLTEEFDNLVKHINFYNEILF